MEVSSHGLAQDRVQAVHFDAAVFTNLTRDHLDFHGDMDRYGAAKASLFERDGCAAARVQCRRRVRRAAGRAAADSPDRIACSTQRRGRPPGGAFVRAQSGAVRCVPARASTCESSFGSADRPDGAGGRVQCRQPAGRAGGAAGQWRAAVARRRGSSARSRAPPAGSKCSLRAGGHWCVVDYAHTPDALEQALRVLRLHCSGQAGVRVRLRRRSRSRQAAADGRGGRAPRGRIVLTDDNPRTEDPLQIIADIKAGIGAARCEVVPDRRAAIAHALQRARRPATWCSSPARATRPPRSSAPSSRHFSDQQVVREVLGAA